MNILYFVGGALVVGFLGLIIFSHFKTKNTPEVKKSEKIQILNAKNFKPHIRTGLVLVDFWAAWCAPCKMLVPTLNDIADNEEDKVRVAKLNVEQFQQVAGKYKVRNLPTLVLFKDGEEVSRIVGVKNKKAIMKVVNEFAG